MSKTEALEDKTTQESLAKAIAAGTLCYFVQQTVTDKEGNYIACIAVEGERGYHLTDWTWSKNYKLAETCAEKKNEAMGIDKITAFKIVAHTMRPW